MKMKITTFILSFLFVFSLFSLDVKDGLMKLSVNDDNGRFSVFYLNEINSEDYISLLYKEDPRTSHMSVNINNRVYVLGESFQFSQEIIKIEKGVRIHWSSPILDIMQDLIFISSAGSTLSDGIHMKIRLRNVSESDAYIGLRYLFDTYLGERTNNHFFLSTGRKVTGETKLESNITDYILSPFDNEAKSGLQIMTKAPGITKPDYVILANWKRLNDSPWDFNVNTQRTFSSPPYSINDSAAMLYYNPRIIGSGQSEEISIAFGYYTNTGFSPDFSNRNEEISELVATVSGSSEEDKRTGIRKDLLSIRDLVNQIDIILQSGEDITDEKLYLLEQIIRNLEARRSNYLEE